MGDPTVPPVMRARGSWRLKLGELKLSWVFARREVRRSFRIAPGPAISAILSLVGASERVWAIKSSANKTFGEKLGF
jgi:hypothetical protein